MTDNKLKTNLDMILSDSSIHDGKELNINLWYPRHNPIKHITVGLMDVRAADAIRISYDFDRDGYVIEQASTFSWGENDDTGHDMDWQEVAFVQAWGREVTDE